MNERRDPDRLIHRFLSEGSEQLHDQVYDAVRAQIEGQRQRVVIGPWRMPDMNKFAPIGLGIAAVAVVLVVGMQMLAPAAPGGVGGAPSPSAPTATPSPIPLGGEVRYQLDGASASTKIDAVADGTSVSGTAVSTFAGGTHTVRLECAIRQGDNWAVGGTTEQTTVRGESAGAWSAVIVKDGAPQRIGTWLSDPKQEGSDCGGWLALMGIATIDASNFQTVVSGALVAPPSPAP